jgi:[acyl-carrier-protein] S-malonyltransferase
MIESGKVAYVFPGQGSQFAGMGKDLYERYDAAKAVFDQADEVLKFPLSKLCFEGPEEELRLTVNAQPALVTMSIACLRTVQEEARTKFEAADFVAGHSLGEYTALIASGATDFATGLFLARERGRLMQEAGQNSPGGMAAILGINELLLNEIAEITHTYVANINCPGQYVLSGAKADIEHALEVSKVRGAVRAIPLQVSGAFHSPLMKPAQEGLAKVLAGIKFNDPQVPIIANTTAEPLTKGDQIAAELSAQLLNGVQWQKSVEYMASQGVSTFAELGPGKVLTGLIKRIKRDAALINVGDRQTVYEIVRKTD